MIKLINPILTAMSEDSQQELLDQISKAQVELKIRLEQVSKLRSEYIFLLFYQDFNDVD